MKKVRNNINNVIKKVGGFLAKYDKVYNWIIFGLLCVYLIYVGIHHEPFRDEIQAWNIARDLSIIDIFKQMYYEGHPCLWHLILKLFTGLPVYAMTWVSAAIMAFTAWLILFKSPFCKVVRTILVFSSPFLYFYSIISRNYCLIALAVTLICLLYNKRKEKPLLYGLALFMLFNTHIIAGGMASILLFFFILETLITSIKERRIPRKRALGCFIGFLGGIVLTLQLIGGYSVNSLVSNVGVDELEFGRKKQYAEYFIQEYKNEYTYISGRNLSDNVIFGIVIVLGITVLTGLVFNIKNAFTFIIGYGFSLFVCLALFYTITSRSLIVIVILMFYTWTTLEKNDYTFKNKFFGFFHKYHISSYLGQLSMVIYCLLSMPFGIEAASNDVDRLMTDSPNVAKFIIENVDKDDIILSSSENLQTVILGYLPGYKFYSMENEREFSFIVWDRDLSVSYSIEQYDAMIQRLQETGKDIYYVDCDELSYYFSVLNNQLLEEGRIEVVYESPFEYEVLNSTQEYVKFKVYKVKS